LKLRIDGSLVSRVFPLAYALLAGVILVIAPFTAYQWYRQPFIGAFIEPNKVVSSIHDSDWPAYQVGVRFPDRLLLANGHPIANAHELAAYVEDNGFLPLHLTFQRREGGVYTVALLPRHVQPLELFRFFLVPYVTGVLFLISGLWAYRLGGNGRPARAFLLFTAATSVLMGGFLDMNTRHDFVIVWALSLSVAASALANLALLFPKELPLIERYPLLRFTVWLVPLIIGYPTVNAILSPAHPWYYMETWRWGYIYIAVTMLVFMASLLVRVFMSASAIIRQQSRIIIFGVALGFGPIFFLYFAPVTLGQSAPFLPGLYIPPLIVLPFSVAYAIVRYRLLDVDRVLSRAVAYGLMTIAAVGSFYALLAALSYVMRSRFAPNSPLAIALYLFLLVVAMNPLHRLAQAAVDRVFYRTRADYQGVLTSLSRELVITPNLDQTLRLLRRQLEYALDPERFLLFLYDDDDAQFLPQTPGARPEAALSLDSPLILRLTQAPRAFWLPHGQLNRDGNEDTPDRQPFEALLEAAFQVYVPLRYEGRLIGFFALGGRRSGEPYSGNDLEFLDALAAQSALALENARLFTNLQRTLDETLEVKNLMGDTFASITSGVITTDLEQRITLFNYAAGRVLRVPDSKVIGQILRQALAPLCPPVDIWVQQAIKDGTTILGEELSPTLPDFGRLYLRLSCTPLRDARQGTKGALLVFTDLTEQRQLEADRERIRQTFGRVVAPRVRDRLLEDPRNLRLDGVRQPITAMFADLSQFTAYSERTPPEVLLEVLNAYLSLAAQAIFNEEGTLDKFMGDAVMAVWNAPDEQPDHTLRAMRAALAIQRATQAHREKVPETQRMSFSIGITRGEAMIGNVGTAQLFNYTAIGDVVNLAQRLELLAEPGQTLLSEAAYLAVAGQIEARPLPPARVKGKAKPVVIYELIGLKGV
jgi:class 3 adenylate cyclase/PAS domain-containing protein